MITLPTVTVVGTLTADPELRYTPSGAAVANFTIACNDRKKNPQTGEWEDGDATFLRGQIWRDYAEHVAESLQRGQRVIAIGQLRQRQYDKDGETRTVFELDAEEIAPSLKWATATVVKASRNVSAPAPAAGSRSGLRAAAGRASAPAYDEPPF